MCNIAFILLMNLIHGELYDFVFCGLVLFFTVMYFISMVHVEETVTSSMIAIFSMILPYFAFLLFGRD